MVPDPFVPEIPSKGSNFPDDLPEPLRKLLEEMRSRGHHVGIVKMDKDGSQTVSGDQPPPELAEHFNQLLKQLHEEAKADTSEGAFGSLGYDPELPVAKKFFEILKHINANFNVYDKTFAMPVTGISEEDAEFIESRLVEMMITNFRHEFTQEAVDRLIHSTNLFERLTGLFGLAFSVGVLWERRSGESSTPTTG